MNNLKDRRVLFYVPGMDIVNNGVYYSQVFGLARYIETLGAKSLVVYSSKGEQDYEEFAMDGVPVIRCRQPDKYLPLPFLPRWYRKVTESAYAQMRAFRPTHVYIRDPFSGAAGLKVARDLKAKVVFSRRGAGLSVFETSLKCRVKDAISEHFVSKILTKADHINSVTMYLDSLMSSRTKAPRSVLPCCVMEEKFNRIDPGRRRQIRAELGFSESDRVVVYSGGVGGYQCTDELITLFKRVHEADNSIQFLILTGNLPYVQEKMKVIGLDEDCVRMRKCAPTEVADYLQTADVGVILRDDDMVNRVASPVKIGEYLSSGLGIVVSPWIGDVGKMLAGKSFAFLCEADYDAGDIARFVNGISEKDKMSAIGFAKGYYTYAGNRAAIESMFA